MSNIINKEELFILEFSERQGFHFNHMQYVTGTRTFRPVGVGDYDTLSDFTHTSRGKTYGQVCLEWEQYWMSHRDEFLKRGWR